MKAAELDILFARFGEVMTPSEVATTVRCSDSHIYELLGRGDLPCFCVGRHYRILKTDVIISLRHLIPPVPLDSVLREPRAAQRPHT